MKHAKTASLVILFVAAAASLVRIFFPGDPEMGAAVKARHVALQQLGEALKPGVGEGGVLVLSNPFSKQAGQSKTIRQFELAGIDGLAKGLGPEIKFRVGFPEIKPEYQEHPERAVFPPNTSTPLSFLMDAKSVDALADSHPDCEVIVSLIGLPLGVESLDVWSGRHRFGLLLPDLRVLGSKSKALEAFESGKIIAAVVDDKSSGAALIVDSNNVKEILAKRPELLGFKGR